MNPSPWSLPLLLIVVSKLLYSNLIISSSILASTDLKMVSATIRPTLSSHLSSNPCSNTTKKSAMRSRLLILMSDSCSLDQFGYHQLSHAINSHYARLHNYRFLYVPTPCLPNQQGNNNNTSMKQCIACIHPIYGGRAPPWCKLLALNETLHAY